MNLICLWEFCVSDISWMLFWELRWIFRDFRDTCAISKHFIALKFKLFFVYQSLYLCAFSLFLCRTWYQNCPCEFSAYLIESFIGSVVEKIYMHPVIEFIGNSLRLICILIKCFSCTYASRALVWVFICVLLLNWLLGPCYQTCIWIRLNKLTSLFTCSFLRWFRSREVKSDSTRPASAWTYHHSSWETHSRLELWVSGFSQSWGAYVYSPWSL